MPNRCFLLIDLSSFELEILIFNSSSQSQRHSEDCARSPSPNLSPESLRYVSTDELCCNQVKNSAQQRRKPSFPAKNEEQTEKSLCRRCSESQRWNYGRRQKPKKFSGIGNESGVTVPGHIRISVSAQDPKAVCHHCRKEKTLQESDSLKGRAEFRQSRRPPAIRRRLDQVEWWLPSFI